MDQKSTLIQSRSIFDGTNRPPFTGYLYITDGLIQEIGEGQAPQHLIDSSDTLLNFEDELVSPGFVDVHCFFSGYAMNYLGEDVSEIKEVTEIKDFLEAHKNQDVILGHGLGDELINEVSKNLVAQYHQPIVLMVEGCETCLMNPAARERFQFTPETCYSEAFWRLIQENLQDHDKMMPLFKNYIKLLNSKGVTCVKEMGFDDYYGFTNVLKEFDQQNALSLRYHFMSQPVGHPLDLEFANRITKELANSSIRFSGFNLMTDESISENKGELKEPYTCDPSTHNIKPINWDLIRDWTHQVDEAGYRFSLHAQGDGAVSHVIDIYETCKKDSDGHLVNRHAITDLELTHPDDLERMGQLKAIAEIYPQIPSLYSHDDKVALINEKVGPERSHYYWNRRKMMDAGVPLSCATDLPLLIDDIPASLYHASGGFFGQGSQPFNSQNTLTRQEVLQAWTAGGAYNLSREADLGTLAVGKKADIAIFNCNLMEIPFEEMENAHVVTTLFNGEIVYQNCAQND